MLQKWETTPQRARKDTNQFRKNSRIWFWGVEVVGSGAVAGLTANLIWDRNTLHGWQVGLITFGVFVLGFFLMYGLIFLWNFLRSPYRQRNEARTKIDQYEQAQNKHVSKYYDAIAKETTSKHWENLAILCQDINSRMTLPFAIDQRYLGLLPEGIDVLEDDGIKTLIFFINHCSEFDYKTSSNYVKSNADWGLYNYLQKHLIDEDSDWNNKMDKLKDTVKELHKKLHALSEVANNITNQWEIILEIDWATDYAVKAGDLTLKVSEAIKPMQDEVMLAYSKCWRAESPIRMKLIDLANRRTFIGKCPACPQ
jgi:hypothetical protein